MRTILTIALKDLTLAFRDRAGLLLMLLAPFVLTLGLGLVTGSLGAADSAAPIPAIPVAIVNQDSGELGMALIDLFQSQDMAEFVTPTVLNDLAAARELVNQDEVAALVIVPAGFTEAVFTGTSTAAPQIEVYSNPGRPQSASVAQSIVESFLVQVETGRAGAAVAMLGMGLGGAGMAPPDATQIENLANAVASSMIEQGPAITVTRQSDAATASESFDPLAFIAPGMAMLFLIYTVTAGNRSLLAERAQGTLSRLMITPQSSAQVLAGKLLGTYLTAVAQLLILIGASSLLFGLDWGDPLGVMLLILAVAAGATGWGMLMTALVSNPAQLSSVGGALMLTFAVLSGTWVTGALPGWLDLVGRITPNRWGLDGFTRLSAGGTLLDVLPGIIALLTMGSLLFGIALLLFRRRGITSR